MKEDRKKGDKLVPISEAAKILGVSIQTIRRWDKKGTLHSIRRSGRYRYFSVEELEKVKFSKPLTISEATSKLGLSATTLRRLETDGVITPERSKAGERLYTKECLEDFLDSEYYLSRKKVQEKVLEPFEAPDEDELERPRLEQDTDEEIEDKIIRTMLVKNYNALVSLRRSRRVVLGAGLFLATAAVMTVLVTTIFFLAYPEDTSRFFGWYRVDSNLFAQDNGFIEGRPAVLGAKNNGKEVKGVAIGRVLRPFGRVSLGIVKLIDQESYDRAMAALPIQDINDIFTVNKEGDIITLSQLSFPTSSYLNIPDSDLVSNLNADYLRGASAGRWAWRYSFSK